MQISPTAAALYRVSTKSGWPARSTSNATEGLAESMFGSAISAAVGTGSGATVNSRSAVRRSRSRLVARTRSSAQPARTPASFRRGIHNVLEVVDDEDDLPVHQSRGQPIGKRLVGRIREPSIRAISGRTRAGSRIGARSTKTGASANPVRPRQRPQAQASLTNSGRAGQGHQATVTQELADRRLFYRTPDQPVCRRRNGTAISPTCSCTSASGRGSPEIMSPW